MIGKGPNGNIEPVLICPETTPASNYGFDVTPARLVTKIITERGVCDASEVGLLSLFPEYK
jgi:methylthioribose-1-phosphate isomerase